MNKTILKQSTFEINYRPGHFIVMANILGYKIFAKDFVKSLDVNLEINPII